MAKTRGEQVEYLRQHHMSRSSYSRSIDHYEAWVVCACGFEVNLPDTDRAKISHMLDMLDVCNAT